MKSLYRIKKTYQKKSSSFMMKFILLSMTIFILSGYSLVFSQNEITIENALTGDNLSVCYQGSCGSWEGFATELGVNKGNTVHFKIDGGGGQSFNIKIYRLGYYQGLGARLHATIGPFTGIDQPAPNHEIPTSKVDCENWTENAQWAIPASTVSGFFQAVIEDMSGGYLGSMIFIVRDDGGNSDLLYKTSDGTWQAYNSWGGYSFYGGGAPGPPVLNHAAKLSYQRPYSGVGSQNFFGQAELPLIRWMEKNGYDVSYTTQLDMSRDASLSIMPTMHKILISAGHDEYWSAECRTVWETARDNGVNLAFFSGNEIYWKTRWEDDMKTLVCYKEGTLGENICGGNCDPSEIWTGLWRDGCGPTYAPPNSIDGCNPENQLGGQISWVNGVGTMTVSDTYKDMRFWKNTEVAELGVGESLSLCPNSLGSEWDQYQYAEFYPERRILLSSTQLSGLTHNLSLYRHNSGALVFAAGTIRWSWGLYADHEDGPSVEDQNMKQAMVNLFAYMGVPQDAVYLESGLIAETGVTSNTPPVTVITSPVNGAALSSSITITGTSSVPADAVLFGVEVSTDDGTTWSPASGTTNWSFSWNPDSPGTFVIKARGWDDLGNVEIPGSTPVDFSNCISVTYAGPSVYSVFQPDQPGADPQNGSGVPLEVGMRFKSNIDGYITSLKYYKIAGTTGLHTGNLWANTGGATPLASVTFTNETTSGWQSADLATPFTITANTLYVVSYFSPSGQYPESSLNYFTSDIVNGPLTAPAIPENGLYIYNGTSAFPSSPPTGTNYWVDVNFTTTLGPETPPSVITISPINNATGVPVITNPGVAFSEAVDPLTVNTNTFILTDAGANPVAGSVSYSSGTNTATFTPSGPLAYSTTFTATVIGGLTDPRIKDIAGNAMLANYSWSFTTEDLLSPSITEHPVSQSTCSGSDVSFSSAATGNPTPTLQWQISTDDGGSWSDIPGASTSPYTFTVAIGDNNNQYRAVWTNSGGSTISNPATLTVVGEISGTVDAVNASICQGDPFQLQLTTATGQPPYSIIINGKSYSDVNIGSTFATIPTANESIWDPSATPSSADNPTATPYELGVKFIPIADGFIKGIRFYKGPLNTGTHLGNLWTEAGVLLASATFINETSTGWQQVLFDTPVAVTANTTYVASYSDPAGYFSQTTNYFVDNTPVISANGLVQTLPSTGNGIYNTIVGQFPNLTPPLLTNYWVDVVYAYSIQNNSVTNNITSISDDGTCTVNGSPISTVVISFSNPSAPIVVSPVNYIEGSTAVPLTATGTNLLWYSEPTGGVGSPVAPTPSTAIPGVTSYYVSQTENGCESPTAQIDVSVAPYVEGWYSQSWPYRRPATISNICEVSLTDYQVLISLDNSFDFTKANSDGSDIRITDADGTTLIPFWIESWDDETQEARIWVKMPTIPLSGSTAYLYYGNPAATTAVSDGNATFILFDDNWVEPFWTTTGSPAVSNGIISFALGEKIQSPDNFSPGNALGFKANFKGANDYKWVGFINGSSDPFTLIETDPGEVGDLILANAITNTKNLSSLGPVTNAFHIYELGWLSGGTKAFIDHSSFPVAELNIQVPTTPLPLVIHNYNDATFGLDVDWVYLRIFVDCEPLIVLAEEQTQIAIDIAIFNTTCGDFEVKLRPNSDITNTLTNIQFTVKWPENTVNLTNFSSTFGVALQGSVVVDAGMNHAVFVSSASIPIDWDAGIEYTVLSFSHDQLTSIYANFEIDEGSWADDNNGEYYVEFLGGDYTGIVYHNATNVYLGKCGEIKVLLQGPYAGSGLMNNGLVGNIPLSQPYNAAPWNYMGTENLPAIDASVIDWILVELRSDPFITVEKKAALLLEDGSIVQYNNISQGVHFDNTIEESTYYIVVHHRNHMPVMTKNLVTFDGSVVDFTVETICYGTPDADAEIELGTGTGVYGMIAGDINSNGWLSYSGPGNDRGLILARIVEEENTTNINDVTDGYFDEDVLMDYSVIYIGDDNDRAIMIPNLANLSGTPYLNALYQTPVPNVTTKSESINDGPIHIFLDETENELQVKITTEEDISIGIMDNVQFTLSWEEAINETMVTFLENGYSQYGLLSQGEPQEHHGIMYLTYVSVIPMELPNPFKINEEVILISFTKDKPGTVGTLVSITENDFTENNNGEYYISLLGKNFTGIIQTESLGIDDLQVTGIKIYPNPLTSGVLYLETKLKRAEDIIVTVLDIQGKTITSEILNMNAGVSNSQIDLQNLSKGVYYLKVQLSSQNVIRKLIKH